MRDVCHVILHRTSTRCLHGEAPGSLHRPLASRPPAQLLEFQNGGKVSTTVGSSGQLNPPDVYLPTFPLSLFTPFSMVPWGGGEVVKLYFYG
jgi:hypothetical protein